MANRNPNVTSAPLGEVVDTISAEPSFFGWKVVVAAFTVAVFSWGTGLLWPARLS